MVLGLFCFPDDMEPNSLAAIPGMGIPDQLKAAMEQEASGEDTHSHFSNKSLSHLSLRDGLGGGGFRFSFVVVLALIKLQQWAVTSTDYTVLARLEW